MMRPRMRRRRQGRIGMLEEGAGAAMQGLRGSEEDLARRLGRLGLHRSSSLTDLSLRRWEGPLPQGHYHTPSSTVCRNSDILGVRSCRAEV